jgi:hypothetical protein
MDGHDPTSDLLAQRDHRARLQFPPRANHGAEVMGIARFGEQVENLRSATAGGVAEQPGRKNAAAVHNQQVARSEQVGESREMRMPEVPGGAVEGQEPRGIPIRQWRLRYEARRQVEIEILRLQKSFFWGRSVSGRFRPKCW